MARGPKIPTFKPSNLIPQATQGLGGNNVVTQRVGTAPGIGNFAGLSGLGNSQGLESTMPQSQAPLTPAMTPNNPSNTPPAPPGADLSSNPFWNDIMNMNQTQWNQIKAKLGIKT